ncbi:MAG: class I SAM-dependent methyltransferase [Planctomycetes bacterium]|nr:class I SAM-dependent methyltransferase [Planctomycetota bacterium]
MSKIKKIRKHYTPLIKKSGQNYQKLDWASQQSQQIRFEILAKHVPLTGASLLDVGCGLADLYGFLQSRGIDAHYTGVDILQEMLDHARRQHPQARLVLADIFSDGDSHRDALGPGRFDVVFCSGAFNLEMGNNDDFTPRAVRRLYDLAGRHLVFNLLNARAPGSDKRYRSFCPAQAALWLAHLPGDIKIVNDYLPHDFTVICSKIST